ncbi:MAG: sulfite exporter TauE/SafE family protein [Candidatus Micrarchaeota archaeon]|nr:sulfite exporter TauE/SafE family protein [Candidatus Micrarchaeota archaeon]
MMEKKRYEVEGMVCGSCEKLINQKLVELDGVKSASARLSDNSVDIEFDPEKVGEEKIRDALKEAGYTLKGEARARRSNIVILLGAIAVFVAIYLAIDYFTAGAGISFAKLDATTSYALLFGIGLVTGLHCIAMCGGFVLSYSMKQKAGDIRPHLSYGAGKLISYTAIGALFGLVGSIIAFTVEMRIAVALLAGLFLIVYGLGMLNITPKLGSSFMPEPIMRLREKLASKGSFATGLATGMFVACGPLQAMYILAAGSGSMVFGGLALFFFGLGTLPVMLGFSYVSSMISQVMAKKITRYSGVLVVALGLLMVNNAAVLSGLQVMPSLGTNNLQGGQLAGGAGLQNVAGPGLETGNANNESFQIIRMNVTNAGFEPNSFVLKNGIPVKWIINGVELNGCNSEIIVREYGLDIKVQQGEQTVEFTPTKAGAVSWSCWMGMIPGKFTVVDGNTTAGQAELINNAAAPNTGGGTCGAGGCGCGCGGNK